LEVEVKMLKSDKDSNSNKSWEDQQKNSVAREQYASQIATLQSEKSSLQEEITRFRMNASSSEQSQLIIRERDQLAAQLKNAILDKQQTNSELQRLKNDKIISDTSSLATDDLKKENQKLSSQVKSLLAEKSQLETEMKAKAANVPPPLHSSVGSSTPATSTQEVKNKLLLDRFTENFIGLAQLMYGGEPLKEQPFVERLTGIGKMMTDVSELFGEESMDSILIVGNSKNVLKKGIAYKREPNELNKLTFFNSLCALAKDFDILKKKPLDHVSASTSASNSPSNSPNLRASDPRRKTVSLANMKM